jgi:hypothetical protein
MGCYRCHTPELEQGLELELEQGLELAELGDGGGTPAPKRGERIASSQPGDEPPSPAVQHEPPPPAARLRRFQLLECLWSSGDTTVIDRDKSKYSHTHQGLGQLVAFHCEGKQIPPVGDLYRFDSQS